MSCEGNIFVGQSLLTFSLYTGYTGTIDQCKIKVEKPNGEKREWTGTSANGVISYNVANGDIDMPGPWKFQSWISSNGKTATGDIIIQEVLENL